MTANHERDLLSRIDELTGEEVVGVRPTAADVAAMEAAILENTGAESVQFVNEDGTVEHAINLPVHTGG